ncbi:MAG: redoxin family protein [Rhodothermales bacterium]|nr:redoxin family protein [Rhodothermales bacterium]
MSRLKVSLYSSARNLQYQTSIAARVFVVLTLVALISLPAKGQNGVLPLGSSIPQLSTEVSLADGSTTRLGDHVGSEATVIVFWSNKCPWCTKIESRLATLVSSIKDSGVTVILINSNDPDTFPAEAGSANVDVAARLGVTYIADTSASLKSAFGAARAPHFFVFDQNQSLAYLGSLDDSPGDADNVQSTYVSDAIAAIRSGNTVAVTETKAFGCMIKPKRK